MDVFVFAINVFQKPVFERFLFFSIAAFWRRAESVTSEVKGALEVVGSKNVSNVWQWGHEECDATLNKNALLIL